MLVGGDADGVRVRVGRSVFVGVTRRVAVKVAVGVSVGVAVSVGISVSLGTVVDVGVSVSVGVKVGMSVRVEVGSKAPLVPGAIVAALSNCGAAGVALLSHPVSSSKANPKLKLACIKRRYANRYNAYDLLRRRWIALNCLRSFRK